MSVSFWDRELGALSQTHQLRQVRSTPSGLINFSSNDYLGLSQHPSILKALHSFQRVGAGSSRLLGGHTETHEALERELAEWIGKETALLFPTGYMTNLGVLTALAGPGDAIVMDRLCHASLIDGARLSGARLFVYRHRDANHAEQVLKRARTYRRRLLVTDSIFSMDGDIAPVKALSGLLDPYDAIGVLDEAHALGVWGPKGRGIAAQENVLDSWQVIVGTLSKSLGAQGGFVAVSESLKQWFVNRSRSFIYTTGLSPLVAEAARQALTLLQTMDEERAALQLRSNALNQSLQQKGYDTCGTQTQIVPILLGSAEKALSFSENLEANGFFAPAIRPPTVPNKECRIRFSLTTEQTEADLQQLIQRISHGLC